MKYSWIKNVLVMLFPVAVYYGYYGLQISLIKAAMRRSSIILSSSVLVWLPLIVGALMLLVGAYTYTHRNSFLFFYLFGGSFLFSMAYTLSTLGALAPLTMVRLTNAIPIAVTVSGMYIAAFWMSLICKIKGAKKVVPLPVMMNQSLPPQPPVLR
jgi:hypothetical protein